MWISLIPSPRELFLGEPVCSVEFLSQRCCLPPVLESTRCHISDARQPSAPSSGTHHDSVYVDDQQ